MNDDVLTPEEYQLLLQLGLDTQNLSDDAERQRKMAEMLRVEAPGMRNAGRTVVAPHFMELIGGLARNKVAGQREQMAAESIKKQRDLANQQNQMIMRGILGGQRPPMQGMPPMQDPYSQFRYPGAA